MVKRVFFFRPTLGTGGADRVTLTLLKKLDRARFAPTLVLVRREGVLLDEVPQDVAVVSLGARRLATATPSLARLLRRERPDVVFSTASSANAICAIAHRLAGGSSRLVLSERSRLVRAERHPARTRLELELKRATYRLADLVTAVSDGVANELVEALGLAPERVRAVFNPIVDEDLAARAAEPVDHPWFATDVPVIVAVGRLVDVKDYDTMLAAFAQLRARRAARLVVLGDGPLREPLERKARVLGLGEEVWFAGFDRNPYRYLSRAQLFWQSSLAEGLPGSLVQAMACGTPSIATDCEHGPREVIQESGRDGFLVPVGDVHALANHAAIVLADPALRARVGAAARRSAERFTVAASLARYREAIDGGPGA